MKLQLQKLENRIDNYKEKLSFIPPIAIMIGVITQLYNLTLINGVSFFSWTQVLNEAISSAGILFIYTWFVIFLNNIASTEKLKIYIRIWLIIIIIPRVIYTLLVWLDIINAYVTTLETSITFYVFLLYTILGVWYLKEIYTRKISYTSILYKFLWWTKKILYNIMITVLYCVLLVATYFASNSYFSWSHNVLFYYKDKVYLSNYFNDKFMFTITKEKRLLTIPLSEIKWMVKPMIGSSIIAWTQILLPSEELLIHIAPKWTQVEGNGKYSFLDPKEIE